MRTGSGSRPDEPARSGIERLVCAALREEPNAAECLIARLRPRASRLVLRMVHDRTLAEDVIQEVMFAAFAALPNYNPAAAFWPWFDVLSRNTVIQELRKKGRTKEVLIAPAELPEPGAHDPNYAETVALLQAVRELPKDLGKVVALHIYSGLTFDEIGKLTGTSPNTWSGRFGRAMNLLREKLGDSW